MIIPPNSLSVDTLEGILQEFCSRDGTDYGERELSLNEKVDELKPKILSGEVLIVFNEAEESVNLINKADYSLE